MDQNTEENRLITEIDLDLYADTNNAPQLAGVSLRTLQRYAKEKKLSFVEIQLPGEEFKRVFYPKAELATIKADRQKAVINPQIIPPTPTDIQPSNLSPAVGNVFFEPLTNAMISIQDALHELLENQRQLAPATTTEPDAQPNLLIELGAQPKQFLTVAEAAAKTGLSKAYLIELWETEKITRHKGKRGIRLFSSRELESL